MLKDFKNSGYGGLMMHSTMNDYAQLVIYYLFMNADGACTKNELNIFNNICRELTKDASTNITGIFRAFGTPVTNADVAEIKKFVDSIEFIKNEDNSVAVIKIIEKLLGFEQLTGNLRDRTGGGLFICPNGDIIKEAAISFDLDSLPDYSGCSLNSDKVLQAQTLWNLINIGYADEKYTYSEQQVVEYLADMWDVDKKLYSAMIDTADTMLMLTNKKEFIEECLKRENQKNEDRKKCNYECYDSLSAEERRKIVNEKEKIRIERIRLKKNIEKAQKDIKKLQKDIDITINEIYSIEA